MDLGLVERGSNLVGENACRKARNHFGNFGFIRSMQNVVIDEYVVPEEGKLKKNMLEEIMRSKKRCSLPCISYSGKGRQL